MALMASKVQVLWYLSTPSEDSIGSTLASVPIDFLSLVSMLKSMVMVL